MQQTGHMLQNVQQGASGHSTIICPRPLQRNGRQLLESMWNTPENPASFCLSQVDSRRVVKMHCQKRDPSPVRGGVKDESRLCLAGGAGGRFA